MTKAVVKICENCNEEFEVPYYKRDRKCCSVKCSYELRSKIFKTGRNINCEICGKEIYVPNWNVNKKYCSERCFGKGMKKIIPWNKGTNITQCIECGKEFHVSECNVGKVKFCNKECYSTWQLNRPGTKPKTGQVKRCGQCDNEIYVSAWEDLTVNFCSNKCANEYRIGKPSNITEKGRMKQRLNAIKMRYTSIPFYNKLACKYFERMNKERGWVGVHAENKGEYKILGYF